MKRFTGFILAALLVLAPLSASALEALTDTAMNDVTAQAGVSIGVDDIVIYQNVGETRYVDTDGNGSTAMPAHTGSLVISGDQSLTKINSIKTSVNPMFAYGMDWTLDTDGAAGTETLANYYSGAKKLTIDIGLATTGYDATTGAPNSFGTAVIIGLPTVVIQKTASTKTIGLSAGADLGDASTDFGVVKKGAAVTAILGGTITIAPH